MSAVTVNEPATAPLSARFDLPAGSEAPGRARRLMTEVLAAWNRDYDAEIVRLLVSEVVTNAARVTPPGHALDLTVQAEGDLVRVSVGDADSQRPVLRPATDEDESGRGMHLVAALASRWGVTDEPAGKGGKRVWFELDSPADPADSSRSVPSSRG
jgi:anti-sigma regulatory factor (Ser/Thr protein kinase)